MGIKSVAVHSDVDSSAVSYRVFIQKVTPATLLELLATVSEVHQTHSGATKCLWAVSVLQAADETSVQYRKELPTSSLFFSHCHVPSVMVTTNETADP